MSNTFHSPTLTRLTPYIFVLLWSTGFIGARAALPYIEPFNLLFIRMLMSLVVFAFLIKLFRVKLPSLSQAFHQMVVGSLIHAAYLGGVFAAIKLQMPTAVASLLVGLQPLLTALLVMQLYGKNLRPAQWLGLLLGLFGVAMVLLNNVNLQLIEISIMAMLAIAVALVGISIGTLYQKHFGRDVELIAGAFYQYLATAIWMAILTMLFEQQIIDWQPQLMFALLWLVFGLSVMAILLLMFMIREGESSRVASYFYLVPPVTAIEAWWLFDESLAAGALLGVAVAVFGVYLVLKAPRMAKN